MGEKKHTLSGPELKAELERHWRDRGMISHDKLARWGYFFVSEGKRVIGGIPGLAPKPIRKKRRKRK